VVSALTMICAVAPSWKIVPTPDIIDKVCKDPEMRKQVKIKKNLDLRKIESEDIMNCPLISNLHLYRLHNYIIDFMYRFVPIHIYTEESSP